MRLRNKKTGEIYTPCNICFRESIDDLENNSWKTLKEFCDDWEDAKEPLIKDEKIRKAVRAWSEVNKIEDDEKVAYHGLYWKLCYSKVGQASIQFNVPLRISDGLYTIEELCGEEE